MSPAAHVTPADTLFTLDSLDEVSQITMDLAASLRRLASEKVAAEGRIDVTAPDILDVATAALTEALRELGPGSDG